MTDPSANHPNGGPDDPEVPILARVVDDQADLTSSSEDATAIGEDAKTDGAKT
ncbi:MAG: hypothetical protein HKN47_15165, partial [Pirellulaceae bacterium]|nr:hypothetical protein [Pirellulaceae bacterium]